MRPNKRLDYKIKFKFPNGPRNTKYHVIDYSLYYYNSYDNTDICFLGDNFDDDSSYSEIIDYLFDNIMFHYCCSKQLVIEVYHNSDLIVQSEIKDDYLNTIDYSVLAESLFNIICLSIRNYCKYEILFHSKGDKNCH